MNIIAFILAVIAALVFLCIALGKNYKDHNLLGIGLFLLAAAWIVASILVTPHAVSISW